jgi:hypothetical protein
MNKKTEEAISNVIGYMRVYFKPIYKANSIVEINKNNVWAYSDFAKAFGGQSKPISERLITDNEVINQRAGTNRILWTIDENGGHLYLGVQPITYLYGKAEIRDSMSPAQKGSDRLYVKISDEGIQLSAKPF